MENITGEQRVLLERLANVDPSIEITWDEERGVAASIRGELAAPPARSAEPEATLQAFLADYGALFGSDRLMDQLTLLRSRSDELDWTHLEYQQVVARARSRLHREPVAPLEVYDAKLAAHFRPDGTLTEVQSSCWREVRLETEPRVTPEELRERLLAAITGAPGFDALQRRMVEQDEEAFPVMQTPRLVAYAWEGGFRLAWATYAYGLFEWLDRSGEPTGVESITFGQTFVDAITGEQFLFLPTRMDAETADTGTGLAVTPLGGPFTSRSLNIVRVDTSKKYRLRNTKLAREIITYDTAGNSKWSWPDIAGVMKDGTVPVSEDTEGDKKWDRVPANTTDAERTSGQQPEVDAHFHCQELYEWYNTLAHDPKTGKGERKGWDNDQYNQPNDTAKVDLVMRVAAHVYDNDPNVNSVRSVNAYHGTIAVKGTWVPFLAFFDGDPTATCTTANDRAFGYTAGSRFMVGHEYQHAITNFSFRDGVGNPGLTYSLWSWWGAVHEGLSDVFGGLFSGLWTPGPEFSSANLVFRNVAYPRDANSWCNRTGGIPCGLSNHNKDHFADRDGTSFAYDRGTILAHCAYLMGKGGVHQRNGRAAGPVLIPVYSLGNQTVKGKSIPKAARIWYRALDKYSSTIGGSNNATSFRILRTACVKAAEDLYGKASAEYCNTVLAFYAVGLQPIDPKPDYGPDVTFLRWGISWDLSRDYIGLSSPDYSSRDLFINNGGASEWNALINVIDPNTGQPTQYENTVYCRVRNVGDQDAANVVVTFEYAKAGTAVWKWQPVVDKAGAAQTLTIPVLKMAEANFADSAQNSPPASASVKWCIPPLAAGETVDHFCLRATVKATNDVNPYNNEVQSNIAYVAYTPGPSKAAFLCGNPPHLDRPIPLDLRVKSTLPEGWRVGLRGVHQGEMLNPGEERAFELVIDAPAGADRALELPLDGDLRGTAEGDLRCKFEGSLTGVALALGIRPDQGRLTGRFSALLEGIGSACGDLEGQIDLRTGRVTATVDGPHSLDPEQRAHLQVRAVLRPWRRVEVSQWLDDEPLGGITVQVQVPGRRGRGGTRLPPTDTWVAPGH